jgi:hypothetical protein
MSVSALLFKSAQHPTRSGRIAKLSMLQTGVCQLLAHDVANAMISFSQFEAAHFWVYTTAGANSDCRLESKSKVAPKSLPK